jgi:hypothetical protein
MYVYPGQILQARVSKSKTVLNGVLYRVVAVDDGGVTLDMLQEYRASRVDFTGKPLPPQEIAKITKVEDSVRLTLDEAVAMLRLTHAMCYASVQGCTVSRKILLLDTAHKHFTSRHLIVGMGRATHGSLVAVSSPEQERIMLNRMPYVADLVPRRECRPARPRDESDDEPSDSDDEY